jgi:hypothetical protein
MRRFVLLLLIVSIAPPFFAQKKNKAELPKAVVVAQYIYVTGWHGTQFDLRTPADERGAIVRVIQALEQWHRYRVVNNPYQADLMLVVKAGGRLVRMAPRVGSDPMPPVVLGTPTVNPSDDRDPFGGVEGGTSGDTLLLSINPTDRPDEASAIWWRTSRNGFQGRAPLVDALRKSVEQSEKAIADPKKP